MKVALIAAVAMLLQDIAGVLMMQYESNSLTLPVRRRWRDYVLGGWRAWAAAWLDEFQWIVGIASTTISVEAFSGHNVKQMILVGVLVSAANLVGSRAGQELGIWLLRRKGRTAATQDARLMHLEAWAVSQGYRLPTHRQVVAPPVTPVNPNPTERHHP